MSSMSASEAVDWAAQVGVLPAGSNAVLLELDGGPSPAAVAQRLRSSLSGVAEAVPGHDTLLLQWYSGRLGEIELRSALAIAAQSALETQEFAVIEIPLVYDGEDLAAVAEATGQSVAEVIELHSSVEYEAAFCGFAPGFAYLTGLPPQLRLARRSNPRTRVPRGSVAIAGEYSGVYPGVSPGGWHLLGTTRLRLFDPSSDVPALITPGAKVRFVK